jgi:hypothetical protein
MPSRACRAGRPEGYTAKRPSPRGCTGSSTGHGQRPNSAARNTLGRPRVAHVARQNARTLAQRRKGCELVATVSQPEERLV